MTEKELRDLIEDMSVEEKIGQMVQLSGDFFDPESGSVSTGPLGLVDVAEKDVNLVGSILGVYHASEIIKIQRHYIEQHPHHIPLMFMMDVVHGMKTVFPVPIGMGATFDPELMKRCASVIASEAYKSGLHVTFAPMADLVRDPRWGRVVESTGEDSVLNSRMTESFVQGIQGDDLFKPGKICACVKHFAAYGAVEAGRDYNTVELSDHTLRDFYLPAYKAAVDTGVGMVMTSFNTVNGIPVTVNSYLLRDILRSEWGFDGVLITDHTALLETILHGYSSDRKEAAKHALYAGVDIDMMTNIYARYLVQAVQEDKNLESYIDGAVYRILRLKNQLGLFEDPYRGADPEEEIKGCLTIQNKALARQAAEESFVLLKNDGLLPLNMSDKVVFIGPYTDNREMNGSWAITGNTDDNLTIKEVVARDYAGTDIKVLKGCPVLDSKDNLEGFPEYKRDTASKEEIDSMMGEAITAAAKAEIVVLCLGEHYLQTGEATSRANIDLPSIQMRLLEEVYKVNKNIVTVLFNGRPLDLRKVSKLSRTVLEVWLPGTMGAEAICRTLDGRVNPMGKLSMSFPYCVGQVPVHYDEFSTGRPYTAGTKERYKSRYLDIPNAPLYPFGYGLSYTTFDISNLTLDKVEMSQMECIKVSVTVTNAGSREGTETVQLYIQDRYASVVQPLRKLKGFKKISLKSGQSGNIEFTINQSMLAFTHADGSYGAEKGEFRCYVGNDSNAELSASFWLI